MDRNDSNLLISFSPVLLGSVLLSVFLLYRGGSDLQLFADDFISWASMKTMLHEPWWKLFLTLYNPEFYRPFDHLLIRANLLLLGGDPMLYHWFSLLGHLLTTLTVYAFARRWNFSRQVSLMATVVFGIGHANAMAVLSNDAASQVFSTFFGMMMLYCLSRRDSQKPIAAVQYTFAALWLAGALLWKDAGISYVLPAVLLIAREWWSLPGRRRWRMTFAAALPFAVILILYFTFRFYAGAAAPAICGPGRYDLCPGINVPMNFFYFLLGLITPIGSSIVVLRLQQTSFVVLWILSCIAVLIAIAAGLWLRARGNPLERRELRWLYVLLLLLMLPDIFIRQVSELYIYRPNTLFAILMAAGFYALLTAFYQRRRWVLVSLMTVFLALAIWSQVRSVHHKTQRLRTNGILANQLMKEIMSQYPTLPSRTILVSNRVPGPAPLYSIYYMEGIYVLGGGKIFEYYYGNKPDQYGFYPFQLLDRALVEVPGKKLVLLFRRNRVLAQVVEGSENPYRLTPP